MYMYVALFLGLATYSARLLPVCKYGGGGLGDVVTRSDAMY